MGLKLKSLFVVAVLAAAIAGLVPSYLAYRPGGNPASVKQKVTLGLDLQGGMYLDLEVETEAAVTRVLDRLATELEDALTEKLIDYAHVERKGQSVEVELGRAEKANWNVAPFNRLLTNFKVEALPDNRHRFTLQPDEAERIRTSSVTQALEVIRNRIDSLGVAEPSIQKQGETTLVVQLPGLRDREGAIKAIGTQAVLEFFLVEDNVTPATMTAAKHEVKYEEVRDPTTGKVISRSPHVLEKRPVLSGETVRDARVNISSQDNTPHVSISLDAFGAERFAKLTTRYRGRRLAIVLDDKVQSAPVIREPITGGEAQITGRFNMQEANNLAIVLRSGALPAPIHIREERTVGASLGDDSIRQGMLSLAIGAVALFVFMSVYYRLAGVFASFALLFNLVLILSLLAVFNATLTLPGIAGIVLTLGMAVDANVLIFERIREELRRGSNLRASIVEGFSKAFWTIFDSNLTTLVAAFALLAFGTGPVKGFAITLSIGILSSMFTAIVVSRLLFDFVYLDRRRLTQISI
ncbi:MAG: protein translocase subunit SecD [Candidatus Lambdaproteobacteria bacterium]|nr:protein translocase subunit SecD [Candidatus Lambdaproteobacteria bacterium]